MWEAGALGDREARWYGKDWSCSLWITWEMGEAGGVAGGVGVDECVLGVGFQHVWPHVT